MFDCILGRYARLLEPTSEADPAGILATFVSATSAIIGNVPHLRIGDARHPITVWTLLCGRTAAGRKGTAEAAARRVLAAADPGFFRENILSGLSSAEGVIAAVADDEEDAQPADLIDKRRLILEPEFGVVLSRAKREGNALTQVMREAWDGRDLRVQTKIPLVATAPHLAVSGHVSPEEFRAGVSQRDIAGGSYNRFLIVYVERSKRLPEGGGAADDLINQMAIDLRGRLQRAKRIGQVRRAPQSAARWDELYNELVDLEDDPVLADWVARAVPYTMRVAGLYAVLDGADQVTPGHLDAAAAFIRYAMGSVKAVVGEAAPTGMKNVAFLAQMLEQAGRHGIQRSELTKKFTSRGGASALEHALAELQQQPGYTTTQTETGGRPSLTYRFEPTAATVPMLSSFRASAATRGHCEAAALDGIVA